MTFRHQKLAIDMIGQRFGRLVVIAQAETARYTRWHCRCDCGRECIVSRLLLTMDRGRRSCGCLANEQRKAARQAQLARTRSAAAVAEPCTLAQVWR